MSTSSKMILKPWRKPVITILLIAELGAGRSSFLGLLSNICAGRTLERFDQVQIPEEHAGHPDTTGSLHKIICPNGYELHVLTLPCPPRARDDPQAVKKLHDRLLANKFRDEIDAIDTVVILSNGTTASFGPITRIALDSICEGFPDTMAKNFGILFTMVSSPLDFNFDLKSLPPALQHVRMWAIDNPLAGWVKYQKAVTSKNPPDEKTLADMGESIHASYEKAIKTLDDFFSWQDRAVVQPTKPVNQIYTVSTEIESKIAMIIARTSQVTLRQKEMLHRIGDEPQSNKNQLQSELDLYLELMQKQIKELGDELYQLCIRHGELLSPSNPRKRISRAIEMLRRAQAILIKNHALSDTTAWLQARIEGLDEKLGFLKPEEQDNPKTPVVVGLW